MPRCAPPAALLLAAVVADGRVALVLLLVAIPTVALVALAFFGDLAAGSADREAGALYVGLTSIALVLLVLGAAVRSSSVHGVVPALGVSTVVGALALLALQLTVHAWLKLSRGGLALLQGSRASGL